MNYYNYIFLIRFQINNKTYDDFSYQLVGRKLRKPFDIPVTSAFISFTLITF